MTAGTRPTSLRSGRLVQLARYLPRVGRWAVLPGAAAAAAVVLLLVAAMGHLDAGNAMTDLRLAAVVLAGAAAFALDDPAAETLAASPSTLRWRRGVDIGAVLVVLAVLWSGLLWAAGGLLGDGVAATCLAVVRRPLTAELVALVWAALAIAVVVARRSGGTAGGAAAGPGVLLAFVVCSGPLGLLPGSPLDPMWTVQHRRLLLGALVLFAVVLWALRDPAGRRPRWRGVVAVVVLLPLVAAPLLRPRPDDLPDRLDTILTEVVTAQGITGLTVLVQTPELSWARTVDVDGEVAAASTAVLSAPVPVGGATVSLVGTTIERGGGVLVGRASPDDLATWVRGLGAGTGPFVDRLAAVPPPAGTSWRTPDPRLPAPTSLAELQVVPARDAVVAVLTAGAVLPPCGLSVADALALEL